VTLSLVMLDMIRDNLDTGKYYGISKEAREITHRLKRFNE